MTAYGILGWDIGGDYWHEPDVHLSVCDSALWLNNTSYGKSDYLTKGLMDWG